MADRLGFRKLAAIDIAFLGYKFVYAEYVCGVLLPIGLGILTLGRAHSTWQIVFGLYLVCLGINYVPMLAYALFIPNRDQARAELGDELRQRREAMSKYRKISILLLVPLFAAIYALTRPERKPTE